MKIRGSEALKRVSKGTIYVNDDQMPEIVFNEGSANELPFQMRDVVSQRSELMEEIVSDRPGFLIWWGNLVFLIVLMLVGLACWFIQYPDIIQATAKLTSINAPKPVISLISGKLTKLNMAEMQQVDKGQVLGYMESTADHEQVLLLASSLETIQMLINDAKTDKIKFLFQGTPTQLGELQAGYQIFSQAWLSFNNYLPGGFYLKKRTMLLNDKVNLEKLYKSLNEQRQLQEQDLALVQKTFDANQSLKDDKVISDFDYRLEQSKLINKKLTLPQIKSAIISNQSQQEEKEKEIMELENNILQQKLIFQQALNTFKSQVEDWKRKYVLTASIAGTVAFASFIQENQQLTANQTICFINPEESQYYAEITIPQANFGKVALGQTVLLKLESYPFQEFGFLKGVIEAVNHIPDEKGYVAKVGLPHGLNTTCSKAVQYREGLKANGEIITKDMRLLQRFYYNLVQQVKR